MKTELRQSTFAGGEATPSLYGRLDLPKYAQLLRRCRGFIVTRHGALVNRSGTRFVSEVKDSAKKVRLVPFNFGNDQNFVLEFGDLYIRFYHDGGVVTSAGVAYEIVTPYVEADLPRLKFAQSGDVIVITHQGYAPRELRRNGNTDWNLAEISYAAPVPIKLSVLLKSSGAATGVAWQYGISGVYADGRESLPRLTSVFDPTSKLEVTWEAAAEAGQELPVTYKVYKGKNGVMGLLREISLADATTNLVAPFVGLQTITYIDEGASPDYSQAPATSWSPFHGSPGVPGRNMYVQAGSQVISAGKIYEATTTGMTSHLAVDVPTVASGVCKDGVPLREASKAYLVDDVVEMLGARYICTVAGVTSADGQILFGGANKAWDHDPADWGGFRDGTVKWALDALSSATDVADPVIWQYVGIEADAETRYPAVGAFFDQRMIFANLTDDPAKVIASAIGDFRSFARPQVVTDESPISGIRLATTVYEEIRWMAVLRALLLGTCASSPWLLSGASGPHDVLTALSYNVRPQSRYGSSWLDPLIVGNAAITVQEIGNLIREAIFDYSTDSYQSNDLSVFADHLFDGHTISDWAYAQTPYSVAWAVRDDGVLLGLTYSRENEIAAWHWHDTDGLFENVCVVQEGNEHAVYVVVKRTIAGTGRRYVERFVSRQLPRLADGSLDVARGVFLDSSLSFDTAPAITLLTGLGHLSGKSVKVLADGNVLGPYTVNAAGEIDISEEMPDGASVGTVGLAYTSEIETMDAFHPGGDLRALNKRVLRLFFEVAESRGLKLGADFDHLKEWRQRVVADSYDAIAARTGMEAITVPASYSRTGRAVVRQEDPLPVTLLSLTREVDLGDD